MVEHEHRIAPRFALGVLLALAAGATVASAGQVGSGAAGKELVEFQPARLIESTRPVFPRSGHRPKLVRYPGMPAAERPSDDWTPEHGLWTLKVRVELDAQGQPVDARIDDNPLSRQGMVRRYERLALRAVRDWRYAPAAVDGRTMASEVIVAFDFDTALGQPIQALYEGPVPPRTSYPLAQWRGSWRATNR